ncbi:hypothetical protein L2E82_23085 [Cichorium intybus]|uniref:Uncharacterized protein n=1 Tax=Cichorium intybus TaxID=13427 RepID=A0ACB9DZ49_CICIN|nr:hypothetical protein L2E82_23085 [Cichorium intybus]
MLLPTRRVQAARLHRPISRLIQTTRNCRSIWIRRFVGRYCSKRKRSVVKETSRISNGASKTPCLLGVEI